MAPNRLSYVKSRRTILRKSIPGKLTCLEKLLTSPSADEQFISKCDMAVEELKECIHQLESYTNEIVELMENPTEVDIESEATKVDSDVSEIQNVIRQAQMERNRIRAIINTAGVSDRSDLKAQVEQLRGDLARLRNDSNPNNSDYSPSVSVRLPKLEVEKFDGDILKYKEFWDHFEVAVGSKRQLKPVEKLNYLRAYLSGEAKRVIMGLTATDENYSVAVDLLTERYGDTQASIDAHYSRLMDLQPVYNHTSAVRGLLDKVESHLRCLQALGEDPEHRHFISLIMSKLPRDMVAHLEETKGAKTAWTVELLRTNLHNVLNAREIAERKNTTTSGRANSAPSETTSKMRTLRTSLRSTTDTFVASEKSSNKQPNTACIFCGRGNHYYSDCRAVNTLSKRREKIRQMHRCFNCLQSGHASRDCRSTKPCYYCKKIGNHHQSLCPTKFSTTQNMKEAAAVASEFPFGTKRDRRAKPQNKADNCEASEHSTLATGEKVILQAAYLNVSNPETRSSAPTRALLDSSSNRTYVRKSIANQLGLSCQGEESFSVGTFGSEKRKTIRTSIARIHIQLKDGSTKELDVNIVDKITGPVTRIPVNVNLSDYLSTKQRYAQTFLADSLPQRPEKSEIGLLIGNDYYLDLINAERIAINSGLYLLSRKLGWIISGRVEAEGSISDSVTMFIDSRINTTISQLRDTAIALKVDDVLPVNVNVQDLWRLETIGIKDSPEVIHEDKAISAFNSTVKVGNDGRYQVTWPWKDTFPELPSNYLLALGRFKSLSKRLQDNHEIFVKYRDTIQQQEELGIIEKVTASSQQGSLKYYIPHHPVVTPGKATTKLRIVYDASAKVSKHALSLNECLYRGPVILEDLTGLLLRFRIHNVGLISDIEKAFLQIALQEPQRDVTRFFWYANDSIPRWEDNIQEYRFCRVPFGVISSPFLLAATIKHHLANSPEDEESNDASCAVRDKITQGLYVDNVITGVDSHDEALLFYRQAKNLFKQASMNLREWGSNSQTFLEEIPGNDRSAGSLIKVLGIPWDTKTDTISIASPNYESMSKASTKRTVLQAIASIFDPMGLFTQILLKAKFLLRRIFDQYKEWDAPVSNVIVGEWQEICEELARIPEMKLDRCISRSCNQPVSHVKEYQLICFCDSSATAYATAVYLKIVGNRSSVVNLMFTKTRLTPAKKTSIPRLELLAALIGVRSLHFVEAQLSLPITQKFVFSDSTCVLHWLKSSKQKSVFVENRLREIKQHSDVKFRYITSAENPSDLVTRTTTKLDDLKSSFWWKGPLWLASDPTEWPIWTNEKVSSDVDLEEKSDRSCSRIFEVGCFEESTITQTTANLSEQETSNLDSEITVPQFPPYGINCQNFSSLPRLYRVTAWITRFLARLRKIHSPDYTLTSVEIETAKSQWDRHIQRSEFGVVFEVVQKGAHCNLKDQLNVKIYAEGLLRCHGRFLHLELPEVIKYPKLLPRSSHYTRLIVQNVHQRLLHAGVNHALADLRQEYWVPQGRSEVKKILRECNVCRRLQGGHYRLPPMPPYPEARMKCCPPFSYVGLDYLGPLVVKEGSSIQKVWICLFTCMSVRAIHLEVVAEMSTEQFLLCLRRFVARRGKPILIVSDNASQFKLAKLLLAKVYGKVLSSQRVKDFVSQNGIAWKFITEKSSWMGGFYERLVGWVKTALKKSVGRLLLTFDQLQTCVAEIESVINSRPLSYLGDSVDDHEVLTPKDFLILNQRSEEQRDKLVLDSTVPSSHSSLIESWKKKEKAHLNQFWKQWYKSYIATLRERSDYCHRQARTTAPSSPSVGDVVLVKEENVPRSKWYIGKIQQHFVGEDGYVRSARVLLPGRKLLTRSIKLLYPLELAVTGTPEAGKISEDNDGSDTVQDRPTSRSTKTRTMQTRDVDSTSNTESANDPARSDSSLQRLPRTAKTRAKQALSHCQ